jgi:hypothetical protein
MERLNDLGACPFFNKVANGESPIGLGYPSPEQRAQGALDKKNADAAEELAGAKERLKDLVAKTKGDKLKAGARRAFEALLLELQDKDKCGFRKTGKGCR